MRDREMKATAIEMGIRFDNVMELQRTTLCDQHSHPELEPHEDYSRTST